ncbi:MAG: NAD(P)-dependent oxidoreductase [Methanocorpusculum parvum]|nr:NAD(P)-dependent oxidoreductase [Methanocorpusculum parvum]
MKILITGATGFIGQNFLRFISENQLVNTEDIILLSSKQIEPYTCIPHNNYTFTKEAFINAGISKIDVVLHMGAFTPKSGSEANDIIRTAENITNTIHLLNNLPSIPKKIINISTLDVYGTESIITEETIPNPVSLYGFSKLYCEQVVQQHALQNGIECHTLRLGHIYGPGEEDYQKLIPVTVRKILRNEEPVIFTDGLELRSFIYITDCCRAIWKSFNLNEDVGPINIVSNTPASVKTIVETLISISGKCLDVQILNKNMPVRNLVFNADKMSRYLCPEEETLTSGLEKEYRYMCSLHEKGLLS